MMETSVKELSVPVAVIVAESNRRGRRLRLARRLRIAGAALTVVALAAVGANAGMSTLAANAPAGDTGPAGTGISPTSGSPSTPPASWPSARPSDEPSTPPARTGPAERTPTPAYTPMLNLPQAPRFGRLPTTDTPPPSSQHLFSADQVYKTLTTLLPLEYQAIKDAWPHPGPLPGGTAGVVMKYIDGEGVVSSMEVTMRHSQAPFPKDRRAPTDPSDLPFQCAETVLGTGERTTLGCEYGFLPDGTWEMVESNDAVAPNLYNYRVRLWRPDGTVLELTEYSGLRDYTGPGTANTRATPPIPLDIWRGVAQAQDWRWLTLTKT